MEEVNTAPAITAAAEEEPADAEIMQETISVRVIHLRMAPGFLMTPVPIVEPRMVIGRKIVPHASRRRAKW